MHSRNYSCRNLGANETASVRAHWAGYYNNNTRRRCEMKSGHSHEFMKALWTSKKVDMSRQKTVFGHPTTASSPCKCSLSFEHFTPFSPCVLDLPSRGESYIWPEPSFEDPKWWHLFWMIQLSNGNTLADDNNKNNNCNTVPFLPAVLAEVDKYTEVEYSMVRSPTISQSYIALSLKVHPLLPCLPASHVLKLKKIKAFSGAHGFQPLPSSRGSSTTSEGTRSLNSQPRTWTLLPNTSRMLYIGLSTFTLNSAAFVCNRAGVLSLYVADDMVS